MRRELAHEHSTARSQLLRDRGVRCGDVLLQNLRMRGRGQTRVIDDILEPVGHAVERTAPAATGDLRLGSPRVLQRELGREAKESVELPVVTLDAIYQRLCVFDGRELFPPQ